MSKNKKADLNATIEKLVSKVEILRRYAVVIFVCFVIALYGILLFKINSLSNTQPSTEAVNNQIQAAQIPHIDQTVVNQLQNLQDNSVNVQSLFNQARNNPFHN